MFNKYLFCLICIVAMTACGGDSAKKDLPTITKLEDGRYEVVKAKRSGKVTGTLAKGFYEIKGDSVYTNLTQSLSSIGTTFSFKQNEIKHKDPNALNFVVSKMTSDSLELNTELKGFQFEISLAKSKVPENEE